MFERNLFSNKNVLVTGGRSGIGYGIAKHFLKLGAHVFICSRKEELLKLASQELSKIGTCHYFPCDIREKSEVKELADQIAKQFNSLDILINNAGGQFPALSEKISENGWNSVINNNLNGTFIMTQMMANQFFIPQKEGIVVNITANVLRGIPGMAHTSAARAAVQNLTKTLAAEWARFNIRVNAIAPGTILSSGLDSYIEPVRNLLDKVKEDNLMKRLGTVEDVSNAVCFLSSPLSSYINGITLHVDGLEHLHSNRMGLADLLTQFDN